MLIRTCISSSSLALSQTSLGVPLSSSSHPSTFFPASNYLALSLLCSVSVSTGFFPFFPLWILFAKEKELTLVSKDCLNHFTLPSVVWLLSSLLASQLLRFWLFCRPFFPACIYAGLEDFFLKWIHLLAYALMIWITSDEKKMVVLAKSWLALLQVVLQENGSWGKLTDVTKVRGGGECY